ncbi:MAG: di-trans,poly-cis-decaprenylcistransferase [Candidatus Omnitrophica bacterium]|nr:di-trans,poly-cis-decaprenylcistransferase [Candidatus Omnitrophota bacterium]
MDGNGRWAVSRGLPRVMGHRAGIKSVRAVVEAAREQGISYLTLYAFSVENWKRSPREVDTLMRLLSEYLRRELPNLMKNGIRLNPIGDLKGLPAGVRERLRRVVETTRPNEKMTLNLALNYGGRFEILQAARRVAAEVKAGKMKPSDLDEESFRRFLYTEDQPDPDLLIRTSGEHRISNFLLWQISYAELYLTPTLWPDFGKQDFFNALVEYQRRERRFGA